MKILWLSWKSITHPDAGGAETYGHEMAKALVDAGHAVTWISLNPSSLTSTTKDGISYSYIGQRKLMYTGLFHLLVFFNYIINWHKQFDLIIDEIHGPPLLTPLYVHKPKLTVIHEVAGNIWQKKVPQPIAWLMQYIIDPLFFAAYRKHSIITVSESTKNDLVKLHIPAKNITIIHNGFNPPTIDISHTPKNNTPTLIFLSEIRPMKGLDRVLQAYTKIKAQVPQIQLWIVGNDQSAYAQQLKAQVATDQSITFYGKVDEHKKYELLAQSHLLVHGSYKEGWGRVIIESNAVGTPAVVFDVDGLREAVQHRKTGFVAKDETEFINAIVHTLQDSFTYEQLHQNAISWSKQFTWTKTKGKFVQIINNI